MKATDEELAELRRENLTLKEELRRQTAVSRLVRIADHKFSPPELSSHQAELINDFNSFVYDVADHRGHRTYFSSWMGHEMFKWPTDLWSYQEIIAQNKPDVIIETGTYRGGSALFLASICDLLDHGEVISIDIDASLADVRPNHPRITYINGSSTSECVVDAIRAIVGERLTMVILDSDHRYDHVLEELRIYKHFVPPGGYLIVEDTLINGHPAYSDFGPGPWEAVESFLQQTDEFVIDLSAERVFLTQNPRGFLRRQLST